jgi:drug/metabolite transporter (DMT)-like permease
MPGIFISDRCRNPKMPPNSDGADPKPFRESLAFGYVCGIVMAFGASVAFAVARAGILGGLGPDDLIFVRFLTAGAVLLPLLIYWGVPTVAGIGWRRGILLTLTGGPLFAILQTGGYAFAPLAHGAIIAPSTVTIVSTVAAAYFLGERLTRAHIIGAAVVLTGVGLVSWHGLSDSVAASKAWIGDLLFMTSSVLWAVFTLLIRHWRLDAVRVTVVVAVLSLVAVAPIYLSFRGIAHLATLSLGALALQAVAQGLLQGVITFIAYAKSIQILGVSRAVLFPATVPAISVLVGIPVVAEIPDVMQIAGLVLVSVGMLIAVGIFRRFVR